ncbi:MAG: ABC transporter permease [Paenibacillaceae bacterium]|nr:ABC transporter permease [Paenibacillaceae bacterium]
MKLILFGILFIQCILSILVGVKNISFLHPSLEDMEIIFISRFPRLVSILVAGCSLSMTGLIMQTITKNKFVSPTTAGTADWARLGILIAMLFFGNSSTMIKMLVAFVSCMFGSFLFIRLLTKIRIRNGILIPLIGLMIGNIVEAVATFFAYRFDLIQNMSSWMQGSFSLILKGRYELLYVGIPFLILGYLYADKFTIAGMGKDFSMNLGLNHEQIVNLGLVLVSVITSVVTVTVGGLPFLDLIVPNIMSMIKGDNLKNSLLDTALLGANFILFCDILGRILIYPYEIPIGMMISVTGSAAFLIMVLKGAKK